VAYALLGCTWLIMKTEGELQHRAKRWRSGGRSSLSRDRHRERVDPAHASEHRDTVVFNFPTSSSSPPVPCCRRDDLGHDARASDETHASPFLLALLLLFLAIPAWRSACGRTSFHRPSRSGKRRAAGKHGFTLVGALFVIPSSSPTPQCPYYVFRESESRRGVSLMTAYHPTAHRRGFRRVGWLVLNWRQVSWAWACRGPFQISMNLAG